MECYFKNKKVMIIVPHEDDELNIVGGLLCSNYFELENTFIVYMTNGDYVCKPERRIKEAYNTAKSIGIPKNNLIFMGYSDQYSTKTSHIYHTHYPDCFVSKSGHNETFLLQNGNEFHYINNGVHANFNFENLKDDYLNLIKKYLPDIIFCIDFDSHCDHRANSLIVERALGSILNEKVNYEPIIYKCFAYPTSYLGEEDFNNINILPTKFKTEKYSLCEMMNPFYNWNERIRFKVDNNKLLIFNKQYRLLKKYRSQVIVKHSKSIINGDIVCFQRRTDNLSRFAKIDVSSGEKKYLNDFLLFDIKNIMGGTNTCPEISNEMWVPNKSDKIKKIHYKFNKKYKLDKMIIYRNIIKSNSNFEIKIKINDKNINYKLNNNKEVILLNNIVTDEINIFIIRIDEGCGISEIEIFESKQANINKYDVQINGCFLNKGKLFANDIKNIKVFSYDLLNYNILNDEDYKINKRNNRLYEIYIKDKLIDTIKLSKINIFSQCVFKLTTLLNNFTILVDTFTFKCLNKIERIIGKM